MRKFFCITVIMSMLLCSMTASAHKNCNQDWKQKMMSEKIAFLTAEMDLTPEEAQAFWPVYNEVNKKNDEAMHKVFSAFKALEQALNDGKSEKEIQHLLDEYLKALDAQKESGNAAAEKYRKVLSAEKVARLYVGEERFRRQHIRRLHNKQGDGK